MWEELETEDDYREALRRFLEICDASKNSEEERELYLLLDLMDRYEQNNDCASV